MNEMKGVESLSMGLDRNEIQHIDKIIRIPNMKMQVVLIVP